MLKWTEVIKHICPIGKRYRGVGGAGGVVRGVCAARASLPLSGAVDVYGRCERCGRRAAAKTLAAVSSHRRPEMDFGRVLLTGLSWSQQNPAGP